MRRPSRAISDRITVRNLGGIFCASAMSASCTCPLPNGRQGAGTHGSYSGSSARAWRRYCDIIFLNSTCQDDKCCMVDENHSEWHEPRIQRSHGGPVSGAAEVDQMTGKIFATPAALAACLLAAAPAQAQFGSLLRKRSEEHTSE